MKKFSIRSTQYSSPFSNDILKMWRDDIEKINKHWIMLFTDYVFLKDVMKGITKSHEESKGLKFGFLDMTEKYYVISLCIAIRNTIDNREEVRSLKGILDSMYVHNEFFTFERALEVVPDDNYLKNEYKGIWNKFTEPKNREFISQKLILGIIEELIEITKPIITYSNRYLTHVARDDKLLGNPITYKDMWDAAQFILDLLKELVVLLNNHGQAFSAIQIPGFYEHLYTNWWSKEIDTEHKFSHEEKFTHWNVED